MSTWGVDSSNGPNSTSAQPDLRSIPLSTGHEPTRNASGTPTPGRRRSCRTARGPAAAQSPVADLVEAIAAVNAVITDRPQTQLALRDDICSPSARRGPRRRRDQIRGSAGSGGRPVKLGKQTGGVRCGRVHIVAPPVQSDRHRRRVAQGTGGDGVMRALCRGAFGGDSYAPPGGKSSRSSRQARGSLRPRAGWQAAINRMWCLSADLRRQRGLRDRPAVGGGAAPAGRRYSARSSGTPARR